MMKSLAWRSLQHSTVALCLAHVLAIGNASCEFEQTQVELSSVSGRNDWFGAEIIFAEGPFGQAPYDDPGSVLGMPGTEFYDPLAELWGAAPVRRVKLVEGACYTDPSRTQKLVTTFGDGACVVVRLGQSVRDDPAHPYGIDFIVFGNAFFPTVGFVDENSDFNTLMLAGGCFCEPLKVSVSPGYVGRSGQSAAEWQTWDWYTYENGPYADCAFPTQAFLWDRKNRIWTDRLTDFLKPVNPALEEFFDSAGAIGLSVADAMELYDGSGGGTGFDLRETGFDQISYVKIEGRTGTAGGEIDAIAAVRPMVVGDSVTIAPANIGTEATRLIFLNNDGSSRTAVTIDFKSVNTVARVSTASLGDYPVLPAIVGEVVTAVELAVEPIISPEPVSFEADAMFHCAPAYNGGGEDLELLGWAGSSWVAMDFKFDPTMNAVVLNGLKEVARYLLVKVQGPQITVGRDGGRVILKFPVVPGWVYTLERTTDLEVWTAVDSVTSAEAKLVTFDSPLVPPGICFYRVRIGRDYGKHD